MLTALGQRHRIFSSNNETSSSQVFSSNVVYTKLTEWTTISSQKIEGLQLKALSYENARNMIKEGTNQEKFNEEIGQETSDAWGIPGFVDALARLINENAAHFRNEAQMISKACVCVSSTDVEELSTCIHRASLQRNPIFTTSLADPLTADSKDDVSWSSSFKLSNNNAEIVASKWFMRMAALVLDVSQIGKNWRHILMNLENR